MAFEGSDCWSCRRASTLVAMNRHVIHSHDALSHDVRAVIRVLGEGQAVLSPGSTQCGEVRCDAGENTPEERSGDPGSAIELKRPKVRSD